MVSVRIESGKWMVKINLNFHLKPRIKPSCVCECVLFSLKQSIFIYIEKYNTSFLQNIMVIVLKDFLSFMPCTLKCKIIFTRSYF